MRLVSVLPLWRKSVIDLQQQERSDSNTVHRLWRPNDEGPMSCICNGLLFDPSSLGVNGEYLAGKSCPCMSFVDDTELRLVVKSWKQLPQSVRETILSIVRLHAKQ